MNRKHEWRPVVGYEDRYLVSDHGVVWSLLADQPIKTHVHMGYEIVALKRNGYGKQRRVHHLVLEAFGFPRPAGQETRHLNGNSLDNRLSNLKWGTKSQNQLDRQVHGTNHEVNKERCPWEHLLVAPNLVKAALERGKRNCLVCGRARAYARYRATKGEMYDVRKLADSYYTELGLEKEMS